MRVQFFSDGNKRTSMLFDNKMMIENGKGIIRLSLKENFAQNQSFVQIEIESKIEPCNMVLSS